MHASIDLFNLTRWAWKKFILKPVEPLACLFGEARDQSLQTIFTNQHRHIVMQHRMTNAGSHQIVTQQLDLRIARSEAGLPPLSTP